MRGWFSGGMDVITLIILTVIIGFFYVLGAYARGPSNQTRPPGTPSGKAARNLPEDSIEQKLDRLHNVMSHIKWILLAGLVLFVFRFVIPLEFSIG